MSYATGTFYSLQEEYVQQNGRLTKMFTAYLHNFHRDDFDKLPGDEKCVSDENGESRFWVKQINPHITIFCNEPPVEKTA